MPREYSFVAAGCTHTPIHNVAAIDWLVDQVRARKPDVFIHLGDMFDAECISSFDLDEPNALRAEYDAANDLCHRINKAAPKARKVWLQGNHEERMFRKQWKHLASLLDYRIHVTAAKEWLHIDYQFDTDHVFTLGQVTFAHGWAVGQSPCKTEAINLGVPMGLYVHAHTHRPHPVHRISMGVTKLPYWQVNTGTYIDRKQAKAAYMKGKNDLLWGTAMVCGKADTRRRYDCSRQFWRAELVLREMFDSNVTGAV